MNYRTIGAAIVALAAATSVQADCIQNSYGEVVCGPGQCAKNQYGKVFCAQPGGGALRGEYGEVHCGAGYCARDRESKVWCSSVRAGGAALDAYGEVKCLGGCEPGTPKRCEEGH